MGRKSLLNKELIRKKEETLITEEKLAKTEISIVEHSSQALDIAERYKKLYNETYMEYEEQCPSEKSTENVIFTMMLESYDELVQEARKRYHSLLEQELNSRDRLLGYNKNIPLAQRC